MVVEGRRQEGRFWVAPEGCAALCMAKIGGGRSCGRGRGRGSSLRVEERMKVGA